MEQDDRTKKLQAGKEKLDAFRRKRARRKKKKETEDGASDYTWSETSSLADLSDVASTGDFSDTGSVVDEDSEDGFARPGRRVSSGAALARAQRDTQKLTERVTELEEVLQGKQDAMSRLLEENEQLQASLVLKSQAESTSDLALSVSGSLEEVSAPDDKDAEDHSVDESYQHKLDEFEEALKKRDEVIAQLTENLRATTLSRDNLQQEYTAQAAELARQVQTLQLQLKQAGEWLKNHMGEHGISAQALLEAKNELLALQQVNSHREQELTAARAAISERDQALQKVIEQYTVAAEQANLLHQEYTRIQQENAQYGQVVDQLTQARKQTESEKLALEQQIQEATKDTKDSEKTSEELMKLKEELSINQKRIDLLEKNLQERDREVSQMKEKIVQKDQSLQQMVTSLSNIDGPGSQEAVQQETFMQMQQEVAGLQDKIHQKDQKLHHLNDKFSQTSEQLKNLYEEVSVLKEKEQEVFSLRQVIQDREENLLSLQNTIEAKEEKLLVLQQSFAEEQEKKNTDEGSNNDEVSADTIKRLKEELLQKEKLLQRLSEEVKQLSEKTSRLEESSGSEKEILVSKLQKVSEDYALVSEENKQLKEAGEEITELASKIPQLSQEIQRLGEENMQLKGKENEMYKLVEQMKDRETIVQTLNDEKQQLAEKEESLCKENLDLKEKVESLDGLNEELKRVKQELSELKEREEVAETQKKEFTVAEESLQKENSQLQEKIKSLMVTIEDLNEMKKDLSEYQERAANAASENEASAVLAEVKELPQNSEDAECIHEQQQKSVEDDSMKETTETSAIIQELENLRKALKEKESLLNQSSDEVSKLTAQVANLSEENQRLIDLTSSMENLHKELDQLKCTVEQKEAELEDTRNSVNSLEQQVLVLTDENKTLKEMQNELQSLKDLVVSREKDILELQKSVSQKDKEIESLSTSVANLKVEASDLSSQISEKEMVVEQLNGILKENESNITELNSKLESSRDKIYQLGVENGELKQKAVDFEKLQSTVVSDKDSLILELQGNPRSKQAEIELLQRRIEQEGEVKAKLEGASNSIQEELSKVKTEVGEQEQVNQNLVSQLREKEASCDQLEETVKEKLSSIVELTEKLNLLSEQSDKTSEELMQLNIQNKSKEDDIASLQKEKNDQDTMIQQYSAELEDVKNELDRLKIENESLQEKEDLLLKTQGEVTILKETLKDRDDELTKLTENMSKLTEEVSAMSEVNELLRIREDELTEAQMNVQQNLEAVNEQITSLKEENKDLGEKKRKWIERQGEVDKLTIMYDEINAKLQDLQGDYDDMQSEYDTLKSKEEEFMVIKDEMAKVMLQLSQAEKDNTELKTEIGQARELEDQLTDERNSKSALDEELRKVSESASTLSASNDDLKKELEKALRDNETFRESQTLNEEHDKSNEMKVELEKVSAENIKLRESLNEMLATQETVVSDQTQQLGQINPVSNTVAPPAIEETVASTVSGLESPAVVDTNMQGDHGAKDLQTAISATSDTPESNQLKETLVQKEEDILILHNTIQTQQVALQQMHKQLTEVAQYVTHLNQENENLKAKAGVVSGIDVSEQPPESKVNSDDQNKTKQQEEEKSTIEGLQVQINLQKDALEDMSKRYASLVEENHGLKLEMSKVNEAGPSKEEDKTSAETAALHSYIQQQNTHMEQMSQRMNEMAQFITQVQEQNKVLQERNEKNTKMLNDAIEASKEAGTHKKSLEGDLQKERDLRSSLEVDMEKLMGLDGENKVLKQKEKESSEVVQQLMKDIESVRRSQSESPNSSDVGSLGGSVSVAEQESALAALRAELEEQHGEQIVAMKQQVREQLATHMEEQMKEVTSQRDEALTKLNSQDQSVGTLQSTTDKEQSLVLEVEKLQATIENLEEECSEYANKIKEQHEAYLDELSNITADRDTNKALLHETELLKEKAIEDFEQRLAMMANESEVKETQAKELKGMNQRLLDALSERDEAVAKVGEMEKEKMKQSQAAAEHKESLEIQQQVREMSQQLQDLARERDEALARIQAQELSLSQPQQMQSIQSQVVDALKNEIDALNAQLNDVTSAKEEALTHVQKLQKEISSQQTDPETEAVPQQGAAKDPQPPRTPAQRKSSPTQKALSPMQQQLLHLQQQLSQESPKFIEPEEQEPKPTTTSLESLEGEATSEEGSEKIDVRLKQMQEIYDKHCKEQSNQIEQLNAKLARAMRERDESMAQLDQYQKHYESHVQNLVEQQKKEAAKSVKAVQDEVNDMKKQRDDVREKLETLQSQTKTQIHELTEQVNGWKGKYRDISQNFTGDAVVSSRVQAETQQLQNQIDEMKTKLEISEKEAQDAKAQAKELKIAYYDLEGKNPNVAGYRQRLEDIESTLKVTWIENEELKAAVATLKSKVKDQETPNDTDAIANVEAQENENLKKRLTAAEAELDKLHPLVGVEVIVLVRQMEELRNTYAHQLRAHAQELTALKCELARYQSLDSDSSESPVHVINKPTQGAKSHLERSDSVDSLNIELGRAQAEHQLEVESLKKSKGEFAEELHAEKERHRDAMARIEQLLKKMVKMQQKHKEETESLKQAHDETVHRLSVQIEEMKVHQMVNSSNSPEDVTEIKVHVDKIINEKQRILTERDQLLQEKVNWDAERERLKGRIAQVVGEKDLIAKERDTIRKAITTVEQDQTEIQIQQRLLAAEKQQLMFEREQANFLKEQASETKPQNGDEQNPVNSQSEYIKSLESELTLLRQFKDQVSLLQQERALLVVDHKEEIELMTTENSELKQKLDELESEKQHELEDMRERLGFEITELQVKIETMEQEEAQHQKVQEELNRLKEEQDDLLKEYNNKSVSRIADWKLEREDMEKEFAAKLQSEIQQQRDALTSEMAELKVQLKEATAEVDVLRRDADAAKSENTQILKALSEQEAELRKLQNACIHIKEERDSLQSEHLHMLECLQQEGADTVTQLTLQIQRLNKERQAMREEQTQALSALQQEYESEKGELQRTIDELTAKHNQDLQEHEAKYEAELDAYKQKHAEILEEVHTLRRENYEMRTVVSDPRTQQHIMELAKTTEVLTQSSRGGEMQADSLSPETTTASEEERDFEKFKLEYQSKLNDTEERHKKDLQDKETLLTEQHELSQHQLRVEYEVDLHGQVKKLKEDAGRETERQLKLARIENERKFVTELQKARQELTVRYNSQIEALRHQYEQRDLHQVRGQSIQQLEDVITRLQIENQDLVEVRKALLEQIDKAHGHQEELQEEVSAISQQKDKLTAENLQLHQKVMHIARSGASIIQTEPNWHPLPEASVEFTKPQDNPVLSEYEQLLEKYAVILIENQKMRERLASQPERAHTPRLCDSLEGSLEPPDVMMQLQDQVQFLQRENENLQNQVENQNLSAHEELGELQGKYIQLVAENESLRAQLQNYNPDDSLDDINLGDVDRRDAERLQSCYATLAEENEVLRAKLGSYGCPTESAAEEENLDLASRYELIRKENEALRCKLQTYTHHGSLERDGCWKKKYDAILHDYAVLRGQLEDLGLPINDSIQKGLEELQVKFDQVVKEKETLQVKLTTVRDNAEQDFRELQARHSELHANHNGLSKEYAELKALLEKDKDKSKREFLKTKSKLANVSKEVEALKSKYERANKEAESLKVKLDQAENRLKQEASNNGASAGKGKKRKQERGNHSRGRKQRREAEAVDDSVEMTDPNMQEELDNLKIQYTSVVRENDALKSEVGGLKCELGSVKSRLMDSLRHRLRDPPVAHSTPLDSDLTYSRGKQVDIDCTPTGIPRPGCSGHMSSRSASDLDLTSPEDVEALRVRYEAALQELSELRNELDRMNSKALDELMGLQSEADALEEENASMKQALMTDGTPKSGHSSDVDCQDGSEKSKTKEELQQELTSIKKQLQELRTENEDLRLIIGNATGSAELSDGAKDDCRVFKNEITPLMLTHRTVYSESEIHPIKEAREMAAVSAELFKTEKPKHTVSLGDVDVDVTVDDFLVGNNSEKPSLIQKSFSMNTVIPRSGLEGGQLEAEWKRILRMRSRAISAGDAIAEEGFHPEVESTSAAKRQRGSFIPDSPSTETPMLWPSSKTDSTDLPLMSIEEEFKLQLESMVANFGEQNVREHLGRDYIEIHQKCEAMKEENDRLCTEMNQNKDQIVKLNQQINELEKVGKEDVFLVEDGQGTHDTGQINELKDELIRLKDENQLLLQENTNLEARCESRNAKSAWNEQILRGDLGSELEHLRNDRAKLEDEVSKIKDLYSKVKEHSDKLSIENEELNGDKLRLERELQVLRSVLEALRQEQAKVDVEIQDRVDEQAARMKGDGEGTLSAEVAGNAKKTRKKSPSPLDTKEKDGQQVGKNTKKSKKAVSPDQEPAKRGATRGSSTPSKENPKGSPMKAREPPAKVKKTSQAHLQSSRESLVFEDKVGMSQLKQKVKELTAKNKALNGDMDKLRKELAAADRSKEIGKFQKDNKALLQELEEMRGSLKSQSKLMDQIQDLRTRIEALTKEKDTLKKENQGLSDRINDGVSPPMMEFEELKVQNQRLVTANQSLMEKLDRDLMQAEHELAEMREKFKVAQMQKEEIEDEYKSCRDRLEKELYNVQSKYDEVVDERDLLETQLINMREHAEKDYHQLQAGYEEMRNEFEHLQKAYDSDKEKARKDLNEIKGKLESAKQDNEDLRRDILSMTEDDERGKTGMQQQCAMLQEEKHNLSREVKEYQNRLITLEKAKEEVEKQLKELKLRYENLEKYYEEEKAAFEEENELSKKKFDTLKAEYDMLSETLEELKMEKNSLFHELNDSHAWCETLEMNLKETESTMHKETVTLKEELQFISEKLENETSVRNSLASAEEELRQKLVDTSQELDRVRREAQASKDKLNDKLKNLNVENSDLTKQLQLHQEKCTEKEVEIGACKKELASAREMYSMMCKDFEELSQNKEAIENEYREMRNKFGVTETELVEFRKSYLSENVESGKLMSRFRVQFEQVTKERDCLKSEYDQVKQTLEEIKAKYIVQQEDNKVLRRAIGAEVDIRFQTVNQIESLLGDDRPPISPISPPCQSPALSEYGGEYPEEGFPSSGPLISKLQRQNTSLALLIQELENIKVARDQQMSRISTKYQSLQASFNESLTSYNQDRSQLEAEVDMIRSQNEEILARSRETEDKLQEMVERCRILEEELLRLQRNGADGTSSSTSTTDKVQKKYVVEMEDDVLTVSTVSIQPEEEEEERQQTVENMQCSPQLTSPVVSLQEESLQMPSLARRNTDPELAKLKDKTWEREYHALQEKYMTLLKEHDKVWQRVRQSPARAGSLDLEGELTIEVTDASVIELIEENSRLHALNTKLENEVMSQRIDCLEVDAAYTELTWLREQKFKLEEKLRLQYQMYDREKQVLEQRLNELQSSLDKVISMKRRTSEEVLTLKHKYTDLLAVSSDEVKQKAEQVNNVEEREELQTRNTERERIAELESTVKFERDEKEFYQVQVTHLKKECELYERHVRDLEKEIDEQYTHLHEASREHKTMVQLLAETKLELELNREKHHQVTKIGQTVERIEAQLSGRSTPQSAIMSSPPMLANSDTTSPAQHACIDSRPSTSCDSTDEAERLVETSRIVDEMIQLRHEIMEAKSMYSRENTLLKQTQQGKVSHNEQTAIKEELAVIEEQNELLKCENEELHKRLTEQEELVFHLQARLSSDSTDDRKDTLEAVSSQQIMLLKADRNSLQEKLKLLEQREQRHRDLLREKTIMEESFNQERQEIKQRLHEKELKEYELVRKVGALERHIREQQRLEDLIYHKSSLEDDIRRQKESFDHELLDVEKSLQERRNMIKIDRVKLLGDLKQKYWQKILSADDAESAEPVGQLGHKPKSTAFGFERLSRMKSEVEQRYREAIDRLRQELHADRHHSAHHQ